MTVKEFYEYLCRELPQEWACEGDYDGMSCCPDADAEVEKVLIALDATEAVVDEAIEEGCQVILAHHPMLFGGIKEICDGEFRSNKLIKLIKNNIAVMSFHTRLDAAPGGVNDILSALIGLKNAIPFGEKGIGRIGELETPMTAEALAVTVKNTLGAPYAEYADAGRMIKKVAVVGGAASSTVADAMSLGADAFVSGEIKHNFMTDAPDLGMTMIAAGHFYTENPVCARLFELTAAVDLIPIITYSNRAAAV